MNLSHRHEIRDARMRSSHVPVPDRFAGIANDPTANEAWQPSEAYLAMMRKSVARKCAANTQQKANYIAGDLTEMQLKALNAMLRPKMTATDIASIMAVSPANARSPISALRVKGYVSSVRVKGINLWTRTKKAVQYDMGKGPKNG